MPIYEYKCDRCNQVIEKIQKFIDAPLTVHEVCGGNLERLISTSALQFKGSGFYITDYKKSGSNGGKSPNSKSGDTTSSTKTESSSSSPDSAPAAAATTAAPPPAAAASTSAESKK
jgi:putative FmdB family regulatory protein